MKNNFDIDDYKMCLDIKENSKLLPIIILLLVIGIVFILYKFNIKVFEQYTLIKENDNYLLIVDSSKVSYLEKEEMIYIDGKEYIFDLEEISEDYTVIDNIIFQTITLEIFDYSSKAKTTTCHFLKSNQTIFQRIIEFMKGEVQ